ncbi:hypothetical protein N4T77_02835 [Clostridium sp. CX1]|uniref:hypothetical protein n=1 Tax=Clostridium sp. CX1 TaxID=2978346 RepID=UPI0021C0D339|nr:hypothetical protein [Clostridium sp. CX1]MCT8975527.1 hypothetical protein [Clostridium sp. CX1]
MNFNFLQSDTFKNLTGLVSIVITYSVARFNLQTPRKVEAKKQQLQNVYLPLFKLIEPHIYKDISNEFALTLVEKMNSFIDSYYEFINPNLIHIFRKLEANVVLNKNFFEEYQSFCSVVDKDFEKLRKSLFLPTRGIIYKINTRQFPKDTQTLISEIARLFLSLISKIILLLSTAFAFAFITSVISKLKVLF